jgi:succinate-semialdehyde dehydrogenase/glutarate-semialdehyde dehydrogenase
MLEADLPPGILQCIPGDGPTVGDWLVSNSGVDAIGFVGSDRTGQILSARAGVRHSLLEMSGNGPTIILDDADLEKAAALTAFGCFYNAGQVCCATERILVHRRDHAEFVGLVQHEAEKIVLGDPFDARVTMGALCNEMTAQKLERHVSDALSRGAVLVHGGKRASGFPTDLYYEPTVIDNVPEGALIGEEGSFGPLAAISVGEDDDDLIRMANSSRYGLQMGLFTSSMKRAFYFADRLRTGSLVINDNTDYWEPHVPFGGAGGTVSGHGRIGGKYTMLEMVYLNTVVLDFMNVKQ